MVAPGALHRTLSRGLRALRATRRPCQRRRRSGHPRRAAALTGPIAGSLPSPRPRPPTSAGGRCRLLTPAPLPTAADTTACPAPSATTSASSSRPQTKGCNPCRKPQTAGDRRRRRRRPSPPDSRPRQQEEQPCSAFLLLPIHGMLSQVSAYVSSPSHYNLNSPCSADLHIQYRWHEL